MLHLPPLLPSDSDVILATGQSLSRMASADERYREHGIKPNLSVTDISSVVGHTLGASWSRRVVNASASSLSIGSMSSAASAYEHELVRQRRAEQDRRDQIRCDTACALVSSLLQTTLCLSDMFNLRWTSNVLTNIVTHALHSCCAKIVADNIMTFSGAACTRNQRCPHENCCCFQLVWSLMHPNRGDIQSCTSFRAKALAWLARVGHTHLTPKPGGLNVCSCVMSF